MKYWHPDHFSRKLPDFRKRAEIMRRIRRYFDALGYLEVETPILQHAGVMEPHIKCFETEYLTPDHTGRQKFYLHSSPEFAMKKLLVGGADKIYQICKTFRNADYSSQHSPEFTMLEWYHTGIDYLELMEESIGLLRAAHDGVYRFNGKISDPHQEWRRISVCGAFQEYARIDLEKCLENLESLKAAAPAFYHDGDTWEDLFFRIFLDKIEPHLGHPAPTILYDYPASMAALSRTKPTDPRFCERFEIYICGLELANAFGELCDPVQQRQRFEDNLALKKQLYDDDYPIDEELIEALEYGMNDVSGIALGIDRLVMLAVNAKTIEDVLAAPVIL